MKRLLMTAAALGLLVTSAQAQLMLPPPPPTQRQTDLANLMMVLAYVVNCKHGARGWHDVEVTVQYSLNHYFPYLQNQSATEAAAHRAKDTITSLGETKFCAMADQDADMQAMIDRLRAGH